MEESRIVTARASYLGSYRAFAFQKGENRYMKSGSAVTSISGAAGRR